MTPLGPHQSHLVNAVLGARPVAAGWIQLESPGPQSFPLGLPAPSMSRAMPWLTEHPMLKASSGKALTSARQTQLPVPALPRLCDQSQRGLSSTEAAQPPGLFRGIKDTTVAHFLPPSRGSTAG